MIVLRFHDLQLFPVIFCVKMKSRAFITASGINGSTGDVDYLSINS